LRSLAEYAPWINHIYLVTDRQIPSWLNRHNKKISVIDHTDIIPHQFLPTFNSHVIEFYLHLIPNLSDHYIYFNDDFFLSAPVKPEYFFTTNGLPLIFIDWRKTRLQGYAKMQTPHAHSFFNVLNILYEKKIYISSPFIPQHGPYAQCKQNAIDAFYFFAKYINRISKNKFRTNNEIAFYSHAIPLYSSYLKKAIPCDITYYYLNIAKVDRGIYYKLLLDNKYTGQLPYYISLNDTIDKVNGNIFHSEMKDFLQKFYVYNSEFESDCIVNQ
jgi:hypothetical protein